MDPLLNGLQGVSALDAALLTFLVTFLGPKLLPFLGKYLPWLLKLIPSPTPVPPGPAPAPAPEPVPVPVPGPLPLPLPGPLPNRPLLNLLLQLVPYILPLIIKDGGVQSAVEVGPEERALLDLLAKAAKQ